MTAKAGPQGRTGGAKQDYYIPYPKMLYWKNMFNEGQGGPTMLKIRRGKFPAQIWASIENDKNEGLNHPKSKVTLA